MSIGASALPTACLRSAWSRPAASPPKAAPACAACGKAIGKYTQTGKCKSCAAKTRAPNTNFSPLVAQCLDCGKGITAAAKSGRCKVCATIVNNKLPQTRQKRVEGWKKRLARPGEHEKLAKQIRRNQEKALTDPEIYAGYVKRGQWLIDNVLHTPEMRAKSADGRRRAGKKISNTLLAWCPEEYRELHRENMGKHHMKLAESKEMILKLAEREMWERKAARHICFSNVIDHLRRFTAVFDHGPDKEKRYRVGTVDLSAGELLKRAEFNGYQYPHFPQARSPSVSLEAESAEGKIAA